MLFLRKKNVSLIRHRCLVPSDRGKSSTSLSRISEALICYVTNKLGELRRKRSEAFVVFIS
jgi:hypothetical protein